MRKPFSQSVLLNIGQVIFSREAMVIRTVLGSCVAICMHHPRTKTSAICHAIYSGAGSRNDTRYIKPCIAAMENFLQSEGIPKSQVIVKLFGGTNSLRVGQAELSIFNNRIVESAIHALESSGFELHSSDTGGDQSRELYFDFSTGSVFVRKFGPAPKICRKKKME